MSKKRRIMLSFFLLSVILIGSLSYWYFQSQEEHKNSFTLPSDSFRTDTTIELEYYIWEDEASYITPVIQAYNAIQSSSIVNLHILDSATCDDDLKSKLTSGEQIDLIGIKSISKMVENKDRLLDLTDYIQTNDMDVTAYGSMFPEIAVNGKYFGIPTRTTSWALLYNKDLFDAAQIPYPGQMTWDEYRALAKKLTRKQGQTMTYGGYWVPWCYDFAALQQSTHLIDDDLSDVKESLELLNACYNLDGSHISYRTMEEQKINAREQFESGNIAMMPQGEWIVNMLLQDEKDGLTSVNWDIAPIPTVHKQASGVTWGQYQFVSIPSSSKHPKEAFDFLKFLCGEEGAKIYAKHGIIHAYSNKEIQSLYLNAVGKKSASLFFQTKKVQEQLAYPGYDELLEGLKRCAKEYFLGKKAIEETMEEFEKIRLKTLPN